MFEAGAWIARVNLVGAWIARANVAGPGLRDSTCLFPD